MDATPKHDWEQYEERCHAAKTAWLRGLTPEDSLCLYESFHDLVSRVQPCERLVRERREEKMQLRMKLRGVCIELDRLRNERRDT